MMYKRCRKRSGVAVPEEQRGPVAPAADFGGQVPRGRWLDLATDAGWRSSFSAAVSGID